MGLKSSQLSKQTRTVARKRSTPKTAARGTVKPASRRASAK
ncbi:MAG: hypothetical protein QNJ98_17270 [Planctomycetota bacterium]|nr:hypothetical protein [Planctomycetota bacterium]